MFRRTEFQSQKNFKNKCWYITRLILQCLILALIPPAFNCMIQYSIQPMYNVDWLRHWDLKTDLDNFPLVKPFAIIYLFSMFWWYIAPVCLYLINGKKNFCRYIICELTCEFITMIFLMFMPTTIGDSFWHMDQCQSNSLLDRLLRYIYQNTDNGCFPSLHVLNTWAIFVAAREKDDNGKYHWKFAMGNGIWTVLVCLSTLFIQQHWIIDVFFSIVIVELVFAVYKLHTKEYAIQKFTTWLNTGAKLEPIYQHKSIVNYRLVSRTQWKKYVCLWSILMGVILFLAMFFPLMYLK